jgi:hypothetical protein
LQPKEIEDKKGLISPRLEKRLMAKYKERLLDFETISSIKEHLAIA